MILVFSTARRYKHFEYTLKSLIKYNPELLDLVNKVYILDDRSTWGDRYAMESDVSNIFGANRTSVITFNGRNEFDWVNKLNFLGNLSKDNNYILFIEDDWESTSPMNLYLHINFLNKHKEIDLITFNGWFHIQNLNNEKDWDYVTPYNDIYFPNPHPNGWRHVIAEKEGDLHWITTKVNNFSLNPSLYRANIFSKIKFNKNSEFEMEFAEESKLKQLFVKVASFIHRGDKDTLHDREKFDSITIK